MSTAASARAELIMGPTRITATAPMPLHAPAFPVSALVDGITAENNELNGYAASVATGVITLQFDQSYDLSSFVLWNDVNLLAEGIKEFKLRFYDASNALISTSPTYLGPVGQLLPETYSFASVVEGVDKVELDVLSSNVGVVTHIEVREVAFNGFPAAPVPEPATWATLVGGLGLMAFVVRRRPTH